MEQKIYRNNFFTQYQSFKIIIVLLALSFQNHVQAQIIADDTLPVHSRITFNNNRFKIDGGTTESNNLFHSFAEFSVPTNHKAFFNNAGSIDNIISRVTGSNISNIDGLIKTNGSANLFLLNPNGIIFGAKASLDVGGSFLASTANSLRFADGSEFITTNPSASSLLSITTPIGLQFRQNSGSIKVRGQGHNLELVEPLIFFSLKRGNSSTGLQVKSRNTLALVGGNIDIEGGTLTAEDGRIELGSINAGLVNLDQTSVGWTLSYEGVEIFQDIRLTERALVDSSGVNSGSIQVKGATVSLKNGSVIWIENRGSQPGGNIDIFASQSLELEANSGESFIDPLKSFITLIFTQAKGQGKGGDINISTQQLTMRGGVNIDALTLGDKAKGGNISIYADELVELAGEKFLNGSIIARTLNSGDAGNVFLSTGKLTILNGSNIISSSDLGTGNAGNVKVNASEIKLIGVNQEFFLPSSIASPTLTEGNAGSVEINTSRLILRDGGQVSTSTVNTGNAGNVIINADEFVDVGGTVLGSINPTQVISSANIVDENTQKLFGFPAVPSGASGSVIINTPRLIITDTAQVTVRNDGTGSAGNLQINANSIFLDSKGGITASTVSGEGGNITLKVGDIIQLRNESLISSTAGGTGNGGNIDINSQLFIALPPTGANGSDIIANAERGNGGNITIKAQGIFGITERPAIEGNRSNDIDASSEFGASGQIQINNTIDPNQGITQLPETVVDPNALVAQNPCKRGSRSQFSQTGRGGLPPSPNEDLSSEATQIGLVEPAPSRVNEERTKIDSADTIPAIEHPIVPAQGWIFNEKGEVVLTTYNPAVTEPQRLKENPAGCPTP
jgi:filamentous hemagglutinin family protein